MRDLNKNTHIENLQVDKGVIKKFRPNLLKNEVILWAGQPKQGIVFRAHDLFLIPFVIFIIISSWSDFVIMLKTDFDVSTLLFTLFGVAMFFYLSVGHLIHDMIRRRKIKYAVTNLRVMIYPGEFGSDFRMIDYQDMDALQLKKGFNLTGRGSIIFSKPEEFSWWSYYFRRNQIKHIKQLAGYDDMVKFESIENVQAVYKIIKAYRFPFLKELGKSK